MPKLSFIHKNFEFFKEFAIFFFEIFKFNYLKKNVLIFIQ